MNPNTNLPIPLRALVYYCVPCFWKPILAKRYNAQISTPNSPRISPDVDYIHKRIKTSSGFYWYISFKNSNINCSLGITILMTSNEFYSGLAL